MPKLIVIGAGIAGLSTAVHAADNGYDVEVFEHHDVPGGVCTAWQREGYTIDGCIQWLIGAKPGHPMWRLYEEIGATDGVEFLPVDQFARFVDEPTGTELNITDDLDELLAQVRAISPGDEPAFAKIVDAARTMNLMELLPVDAPELTGWLDKLALGWRGRKDLLYMLTHRATIGELRGSVRHPVLHDFLARMFPDIPFAFATSIIGELARGHLFTVQGGSHRFASAIARRLEGLGGKIRYRHDVEEILVENDRAIGVQTTDGERHLADRVVSCAPGYTTIFRMLAGKYADDEVRRRYGQWPMFSPIAIVSFGTTRTWPDLTRSSQLHLQNPFVVGHREVRDISVRNYTFDPTLAPKGGTVIQTMVETDFDLWHDLHHAPRRYAETKRRLADDVRARLRRHAPGIDDAVAMTDVATPYTFWRFARSHRGAYEGFMPTRETMRGHVPKTLPGLQGFHMAGQWVEPGGGIPPAVYSGRQVMQLICKEDGRPFVTRDVAA
jgi:phytoene dehydrogenase-like protein